MADDNSLNPYYQGRRSAPTLLEKLRAEIDEQLSVPLIRAVFLEKLSAEKIDVEEVRRGTAAKLATPGLKYDLTFAGSTNQYLTELIKLNPELAKEYLTKFCNDIRDCHSVSIESDNDAAVHDRDKIRFGARNFMIKINKTPDGKNINSVQVESSGDSGDNGKCTLVRLPVNNWNTRFILDKINIEPFLL